MVGLAGGSAGVDIIFHEVCQEVGIRSVLCLPYSISDYVSSSVQYAGSEWVGRFARSVRALNGQVHVLASTEVPSWLGVQRHYSVWQRNLKWMFSTGMEEGDGRLRLLALWDGRERTGYGGVSDFVHHAQAKGIPTDVLSIGELTHLEAQKGR